MKIVSVYPLPGISYSHDANACVVSDDGVLFAAEEERFLRAQHAIGHFPERSAMMALKHTNLFPSSVDRLVVTSLENCSHGTDYRRRVQFAREQLLLPESVPVSSVPHHLAHSALAVLTSPFEDCVFLTLDAGGDGQMGHWGTFRRGRFRLVETFGVSPAHLYQFLTSASGFPLFEEGKTMGLAAYGQIDERLLGWLRRHFWIKPGGAALETDLTSWWGGQLDLNRVDPDAFARHKYLRWRLEYRAEGAAGWLDEMAPPDVARTGQHFFEQLLEEIVSNLIRRTGLRSVACAGGAFLNVAATGRLRRSFPGTEVYVPVAPHDAGLSLGAALWTQHIFGRPRPPYPLSALLGPEFSSRDVEDTLREFGLPYERPAELEWTVARAIADGKVVGWFDGRAEYGARALGARSVLADPRDPRAKARLNQLLKKRDWFMPFAPSILEEHGSALFEDFTPSPYMNTAFRVRPDKVNLIPSAVHDDGTCRAHSVSRIAHPRYHDLISRFFDITGVPALLNTSFNRHGLPMVATPRQAVQHLLEGCVDLLAIGGFLVSVATRTREAVPVDDPTMMAVLLLSHAGKLAQSGRAGSAGELLARIDANLASSDHSFLYHGAPVWAFTSPLPELEAWWLSRVQA